MLEKENTKDHEGKYVLPKLLTPLDIELHVRDLYTNEAFLDFQKQAILSIHYFPIDGKLEV